MEEKNKEVEALRSQAQRLRENVTHKDGLLEELKKRVENKDGQCRAPCPVGCEIQLL